jgi:hypothetical protein
MNKKYISYVIITLLCLNLLTQTSSAFKLNEAKTDVIYDSENEKDGWENLYLPHAKHLGLVNKKTTILDIVKKAEEEKNNDLIIEIMNRTHYERAKMLVKWEKDNGYIISEKEKYLEITPLVRKKLLAEIEEEEERESEKTYNFSLKVIKATVCTASAIATFTVAKYKKLDMKEAVRLTATIFAFVTAGVSGLEVIGEVTWNKIKQWGKGEDEIKLPPLRNMPEIPKGHKKIDVYSL